jgi:hypothetical protein
MDMSKEWQTTDGLNKCWSGYHQKKGQLEDQDLDG